MKAPNGKDTNLNERQWLQVRTKSFSDWFGDWINNPEDVSKVVDENSEPLMMYHGDSFALGENNFVPKDAMHFGTVQAAEDITCYKRKAGNKNITEVFLNIRNPQKVQDIGLPKWDRLTGKARENGNDGIVYLNIKRGQMQHKLCSKGNRLRINQPEIKG
jgi:hypothetical protein